MKRFHCKGQFNSHSSRGRDYSGKTSHGYPGRLVHDSIESTFGVSGSRPRQTSQGTHSGSLGQGGHADFSCYL